MNYFDFFEKASIELSSYFKISRIPNLLRLRGKGNIVKSTPVVAHAHDETEFADHPTDGAEAVTLQINDSDDVSNNSITSASKKLFKVQKSELPYGYDAKQDKKTNQQFLLNLIRKHSGNSENNYASQNDCRQPFIMASFMMRYAAIMNHFL